MKEDNTNESQKNTGISRRGFLKGAGLTTAGTVMLQSGLLGKDKETIAAGEEVGIEGVVIRLKVNGKMHSALVEPRDTLAYTLREKLGLTGTKVVCDRGSCSACTVWVDNIPVNSCSTLALEVGDSEVTTVEGLAKDGKLHPVQEAFIEHDASMCGFCTPGMVMSAAHLLETNKNPSLADVKNATRGNLCRCGTYPHVFKATLEAAKKMS
ncbi:MAG: (2Fe-2S)-binding protein [Cyclobacteriaceae bacterium]|nr:(2Fe-2S)-binding protein [Cyclobacteriaceae bacterium]